MRFVRTVSLAVGFAGIFASGCGARMGAPSSSGGGGGGGKVGLHVEGNRLVDGGKTVRLLGVDRSGSEYACIQGWGFFDGPVDATAVSAMVGWHPNAVRVPLNEDCWLAINGAPAQYSGAAYQGAIAAYVGLLRAAGLYVILDLHWAAPGSMQATQQLPMADADHAPAFWSGVAAAYKGDHGVLFDLYNEPYVTDWGCWLDGCSVTGTPAGTYTTAGMQQLLSAVRAAGAENVVMAGGIAYANDLSGWLAHQPSDPAGNLAASHHSYSFNTCASASCWTSELQPVAAKVPLVTGELGENDCAHGYIDGYMTWADGAGVSYLGWAWNADFNCNNGPALVSDWTGTPTAFGAGLQTHLATVNP
jgi:endoglucanase